MTTSSLCGKPDDDQSRRSWTNRDWYTHVGAWENERGQLCFGSTIAFCAMLTQFHRVWTASPQPPAGGEPEVLARVAGHDALHWNGPAWRYTPMGTELIDRAHLTARQARLQAAEAREKELKAALQFYADKQHYCLANEDEWDSVSGEPHNILWHEEDPAFVEDGSIALEALAKHGGQ